MLVLSAKIFETKAAAKREIKTLRGWNNIRIVRAQEPLLGCRAPDGRPWFIKTEGGTLCDDGFVRHLR